MKNFIKKFKKLSRPVKIQLLLALACTLAIPAYAWFAYRDRIEAMSKVKEPLSINLASGGKDPAIYVTLENLDVTAGTQKSIIFSVEPGKYSAYDIQIAHTTNIPFTYQLYRVKEDENGTIIYTDHTIDTNGGETEVKYSVMTGAAGTTLGEVILTNINPDDGSTGRVLGDESDLTAERKNYALTDEVNQFVKPLYSVARRIPQLDESVDDSAERDYYELVITWTQGNINSSYTDVTYWNYAFNNKETDLIYISAKQNTTAP